MVALSRRRKDRYGSEDRFLAKETTYVIGIDPTADRPIFYILFEDLNRIFVNLSRSERLTFAKRQVLSTVGRRLFRPSDESSTQFAERVIQEFPNEEVAKRLKRQLAANKGVGKKAERRSIEAIQARVRLEAVKKAEEQILFNAMHQT